MTYMPKSEDPTTRCVECGLEVPREAKVCAHCGNHQRTWRNEIVFVSTLVGIASVTVTSIAFLVSLLPEIRSILAWRDQVEVVEFDGLGPIVLANRGDGPVYVSDLRSETGPFSFVRRINAVIESGEVGVFLPDSTWARAWRAYRVPRLSEGAEFVRDSASGYFEEAGCETVIVVSESSASFRLWEAGMGEEFPVLEDPAQVVLRYYGVDSGDTHQDTLMMPAVHGRRLSCDG